MKKNEFKLSLKKEIISNFQAQSITGGETGGTHGCIKSVRHTSCPVGECDKSSLTCPEIELPPIEPISIAQGT